MITIFILILVVMILAMAQNNIDTSTIDKTIATLNWTSIGGNVTASLERSADGMSSEAGKSIIRIAEKAVDFFGYSIFEIAKLAMQFARDHPDIANYKVLLWLIILSLIAPLIYPAFIIIVSLILITKEYFKSRKEKKALKQIQIDKEQWKLS
jgi:hypothetical protein